MSNRTVNEIVLSAVDKTRDGAASARRNLEGIDKAVVSLNGGFGNLAQNAGSLFGVGGIALGVTAWSRSLINAADQLQDMSERSGESVELINGLGYAAQQSGSDIDTMALGLRNLNDNLSKAANGDKKTQALLDALRIKSKTAGEAVFELADAIPRLNAADRTSVALDLLGRAGESLIPSFLGGRQALEDLVREGQELRPITTQLAKDSAAFNDQIDKLGISLKAGLLPTLHEVVPELNRMIEIVTSKGFLDLTNGLGMGDFSDVRASIRDAEADLKRLGETRAAVERSAANNVPGLRSLPIVGTESDLAALDLQIAATQKRLATLQDYARKTGQELDFAGRSRQRDGRGGVLQGGDIKLPPLDTKEGKTDAEKAAERVAKELVTQRERFNDIVNAAQEALFPVDKYEAMRKEAEKLYAADRATLDSHLQRIDALQKQDGLMQRQRAQAEEQKKLDEDRARSAERLAQLLSADPTGALKGQLEDVMLLSRALDEGKITQDQYTEALRRYYIELDRGNDKQGEFAEMMRELSGEMSQSLRVAFTSTDGIGDVFDTLAERLQNILWEKIIFEPIEKEAQKAIEEIAKIFQQEFGSSSTSSGGSWLSMVGSLVGAYFSGSSGTTGSTGSGSYGNTPGVTYLATGTNYVPYDNFPAMLHKGEAVVPAQYNPAAGGVAPGDGGLHITNYITVQQAANATPEDTGARVSAEIDRRMAAVADSRIMNARRQGGLLNG